MARWRLELLKAAYYDKVKARAMANDTPFTLKEIAEHTGLPVSTVRLYVIGEIENPNLDKLSKIAAELGVTVSSLIEEDDPQTAPQPVEED